MESTPQRRVSGRKRKAKQFDPDYELTSEISTPTRENKSKDTPQSTPTRGSTGKGRGRGRTVAAETSTHPHCCSPKNKSTVKTDNHDKWIANSFFAGQNARLAGNIAALQDVTPQKPGRRKGRRQIVETKKLCDYATSTDDQDVLTDQTNAVSDKQYNSLISAPSPKVHFDHFKVNYIGLDPSS